jgi:hypothetical protein
MRSGALDGGWEDGNDEMSFEPFELKHLGEECEVQWDVEEEEEEEEEEDIRIISCK